MNTKARGDYGEQLAREYLEEKGYKILFKNVKLAGCEVDIVAECYLDEIGNLIPNKRRKDKKESSVFAKIKRLFGIGSNRKKSVKAEKQDGERTIVFCEVKTREDEDHGAPEEAVDGYKKGRYVRAAKAYQSKYGEQDTPLRFDVITVEGDKINHIENAFVENDARYSRR